MACAEFLKIAICFLFGQVYIVLLIALVIILLMIRRFLIGSLSNTIAWGLIVLTHLLIAQHSKVYRFELFNN